MIFSKDTSNSGNVVQGTLEGKGFRRCGLGVY